MPATFIKCFLTYHFSVDCFKDDTQSFEDKLFLDKYFFFKDLILFFFFWLKNYLSKLSMSSCN